MDKKLFGNVTLEITAVRGMGMPILDLIMRLTILSTTYHNFHQSDSIHSTPLQIKLFIHTYHTLCVHNLHIATTLVRRQRVNLGSNNDTANGTKFPILSSAVS